MLVITSCRSLNPSNPAIEVEQDLPIVWSDYQGKSTLFFDLLHVNLDLTIDLKEKNIFGSAALTVKPFAYPQDIIRLDILGLQINTVEATQDQLNVISKFETDESSLYIYFEKTIDVMDTITINVTYKTIPFATICPDEQLIYFEKADSAEIPTAMWTTQSEDAGLTWYPTFFAPNEWSTFEFRLNHDKDYKSYTSGNLVATTEEADHLSDYWVFERPIPASSLSFYLGKDTKKILSVYNELNLPYPESNELNGFSSNKLLSMLNFYDSLFGYALNDQPVYVFQFEENYLTFSENQGLLRRNTTSEAFIDVQEEWQVSSALSSRWFSGLVNHARRADLSVIKSLQAYAGHLWIEKALGSDTAIDYLMQSVNANWELFNSDISIIDYFNVVPNANWELTQIKGMYAFQLLRNYIGDQVFFNSIRHLIQTHTFQSVDIQDIQKSFEKMSGEDLTWFFQQWFFWPGLPIIESSYTVAGDTLLLNVVQNNVFDRAYRITTYLDIYFEQSIIQYPILIEKSQHLFKIPIKSVPQAIVIDPYFDHGVGCYRNLNQSTLLYLLLSEQDDPQLKTYALQELIAADYFKELKFNQIKQILNNSNEHLASQLFNSLSIGKTSLTRNQLIELIDYVEHKQGFQESVAYLQLLIRAGKTIDWNKWARHELAEIRAFVIAQQFLSTSLPASDLLSILSNDQSIEVQLAMAELMSEKGVLNYSSWFVKVIISSPSDHLPIFLDYFFIYLNKTKELLSENYFNYFYELSAKSNLPVVRLKSAQLLTIAQNEQLVAITLDKLIMSECNDELVEIYQLMKEQLNK